MSILGERIEGHIFKFVERELYFYKVNKGLIENWDKESNEIAGEIKSALSNLGDENSDRFSENKITNPTSAKAMRLASMAGKVDRARWYVRAIEDVIEMLNVEDKKLVELKYFQAFLTNAGVWRELHIESSTFYERRNAIVEKFAIRMGML